MDEKLFELQSRIDSKYAKETEEDRKRYNESAKRFKDSLVLFADELAKKEGIEIMPCWIEEVVVSYECTDEYLPTSERRWKEVSDINKEYFYTMEEITKIGLRKREAQEKLNDYLNK